MSESCSRRFAGEAEALLSSLVDHEKSGVPKNAGKEGKDGFDLVYLLLKPFSHLASVCISSEVSSLSVQHDSANLADVRPALLVFGKKQTANTPLKSFTSWLELEAVSTNQPSYDHRHSFVKEVRLMHMGKSRQFTYRAICGNCCQIWKTHSRNSRWSMLLAPKAKEAQQPCCHPSYTTLV